MEIGKLAPFLGGTEWNQVNLHPFWVLGFGLLSDGFVSLGVEFWVGLMCVSFGLQMFCAFCALMGGFDVCVCEFCALSFGTHQAHTETPGWGNLFSPGHIEPMTGIDHLQEDENIRGHGIIQHPG